MKTAMQLMLWYLENEGLEESGAYYKAKMLLEKEKEQFDDMFDEGFESAYQHFVNGKDFVKFEDYYNQTYNQNK